MRIQFAEGDSHENLRMEVVVERGTVRYLINGEVVGRDDFRAIVSAYHAESAYRLQAVFGDTEGDGVAGNLERIAELLDPDIKDTFASRIIGVMEDG